MAVLTRALLALACLGVVSPALAGAPPEAQVKAGLLYNLAKFVDWPTRALAPGSDLTICLAGGDPLGQLAGEMTGRRINDRTIRVRMIDDSNDPRICQILFVVPTTDDAAAKILQRVGSAPVLTIGESPRFTATGGVIRLFHDSGHMRFEVNVARLERTGLQVSSKVLAMAQIVRFPGDAVEGPTRPAVFTDGQFAWTAPRSTWTPVRDRRFAS